MVVLCLVYVMVVEKTIKDYKEAGVVEAHCQKMKRNGVDILNANGLHYIEMTLTKMKKTKEVRL